MTGPTTSVIVVSRGRPDALMRCLTGLDQLQYFDFEIVVVADPEGAARVRGSRFFGLVKVVEFDVANISAARNSGIDHASGEVIAFIDDDAVPEPTWLTALVAPFAEVGVAATGGFVRGRNGISWQWQGRQVDRCGVTRPLERGAALEPGFFVKTEGTNMAVRADVLQAVGGFDERYRFFLDETDLNLRLGLAGYDVRLCPDAEVHHGFEASARRRSDRVPLDLFEIGASWGVFLMSHAPAAQMAERWEAVQAEERARLCRHMVSGGLEPRDVTWLSGRLLEGFSEAAARGVFEPIEFQAAPDSYLRYPSAPKDSIVLDARPLTLAQNRAEAERLVEAGHIVTLICLSRSSLFHRVRFSAAGVWEQTGGIFGKSERTDRVFRIWQFADRVARERRRVAKARQIRGN